MSRTVTPSVDARLTQEHVVLCYLLELDFVEGTEYLCNAGHDIVYNGNTYIPAVGQVGEVRETATGEVVGMQMAISGDVADLISAALNSDVQGRDARLYVAFFDDNMQVLADPVLEWRGRMDTLQISEDLPDGANAGNTTITLTCENRSASFSRPAVRRHNMEDHHRDYPDDMFYQYVAEMTTADIVWPNRLFFAK